MRVRDIARIIAVPTFGAISKGAIGTIPLYEGGLGAIGVIEVPAPCSLEKVQRAHRATNGEVRLEFEGRDERRDITGQFRRDGTYVSPAIA